jgi:hypothetical protein
LETIGEEDQAVQVVSEAVDEVVGDDEWVDEKQVPGTPKKNQFEDKMPPESERRSTRRKSVVSYALPALNTYKLRY